MEKSSGEDEPSAAGTMSTCDSAVHRIQKLVKRSFMILAMLANPHTWAEFNTNAMQMLL